MASRVVDQPLLKAEESEKQALGRGFAVIHDRRWTEG
jgi:hypothetical protein